MRKNKHRLIRFSSGIRVVSRVQCRSVRRFFRSEQGLTMTEYAVAAGLIAASLTVSMSNLGQAIDAIILAVIAFM